MNRSATSTRAFSLVEVVVAVGVFVAGVVGALALLSSTTGQTSQMRDVLTATRVGESAAAWLSTRSAAEITAAVAAGAEGAWWADREGRRMSWQNALAQDEAYFLITLEDTTEEVGADQNGTALGRRHRLRVEWPLWQTAAHRTPAAAREVVILNVFVSR